MTRRLLLLALEPLIWLGLVGVLLLAWAVHTRDQLLES